MSVQNSKNSKKFLFNELSILRKVNLAQTKQQQNQSIKSFKRLPLIKQRKCLSTKNLIVSNTCEITPYSDEMNEIYVNKSKNNNKIMKRINKKDKNVKMNISQNICDELKQYVANFNFNNFQSSASQNACKFDKKLSKSKFNEEPVAMIKKYSSCNRLTSLAHYSDHFNVASNDQSSINHLLTLKNHEPCLEIKSSNSIKSTASGNQHIMRLKLDRHPFKRLLKNSHLSKTINPRKVETQNSIEIENEQKNIIKKLSKASKEKLQIKNKILVKNPFDKLAKKKRDQSQILQIENYEKQTNEFRLSQIFQDIQDQSQISMDGKSQLLQLIHLIH